MARATHKGHCQVCGALQMLPSGVLAKHGYTVDWGFFNGTCYGSGHLPIEQDKTLVLEMIDRALGNVAALKNSARYWQEQDDPSNVQREYYFPPEGYARGRYGFLRTELHEVETVIEATPTRAEARFTNIWFKNHKGEMERDRMAGVPSTLEAAALYYNGRYAAHLHSQAEQQLRYATWQQERADTWFARPLLERGAHE